MNSKRFLIKFQYLGFRFHGVQKQLNIQSIQGRIEKLVNDTLKSEHRTRFASRTDAMVSAEESFFLIMFNELMETEKIKKVLAQLPPDIKVLEITEVEDSFTMLKAVKEKTYHYYFSHNVLQAHPFAAPFMALLTEELDLELMKIGAKEMVGTHEFSNFCYRPKPGMNFTRTIYSCEINVNQVLTASFFPATSFVISITGERFMRGQVRLMVGALFRLGKHEITLDDLKKSLQRLDSTFIKWMVPSSGLILHKTTLK
jgi:tRNA pseudouridine38-40 synthase